MAMQPVILQTKTNTEHILGVNNGDNVDKTPNILLYTAANMHYI